MTLLIPRNHRIGRGYLAREGDSGAVVWATSRDDKAVSKGTLRAAVPARPGQLVFSGVDADAATAVRSPNEAGAYLTGTLALVFTRLSGAAGIVAGVSTIGVTHNDDTGGTVSPTKQGDATIFSAFSASFGAAVDTVNVDLAAITAVKGSVFPATVLCYAYGSNTTPSDVTVPGNLNMSLATTYRSVGGGVSKTIGSIAPCSGVRATVSGTLIATVTLNADGTYGVV